MLVALFALLVLGWGVGAWSAPRPDEQRFFPGLTFAVSEGESGPLFTLGANVFTGLQLSQFVAGVTQFLESARALEPGERVVLRQDGLSGYLALSATRAGAELAFTVTLHAEAPTPVVGEVAVRGLAVLLADQVLTSGPPEGRTY